MEEKTLKERFEEMKEQGKGKLKTTKQWCGQHKTELIAIGTVVLPTAVELIKVAAKKENLNEEKRLKECYMYERTANIGQYYELRRKLKPLERLQVSERSNEGESLGKILNDMGVLK